MKLKASVLEAKYKRALFNSTRSYESVSAAVNLSRIYDHILEKKSRVVVTRIISLNFALRENYKSLFPGELSKVMKILSLKFVLMNN